MAATPSPSKDSLTPPPPSTALLPRIKESNVKEIETRGVHVYGWGLRTWHWVTAGCIVTLAITGYLIGSPLPSIGGEASDHFMFGTVRFIHFSAGQILAVAFLLRLLIAVTGGYGMAHWYPRVEPPIPVGPDFKVAGTPEQIERGRYLVSFSCGGCHSQKQDFNPPLSGGTDMSVDIPIPIGAVIVGNLTPDGPLKDYTDAQLFRTIRHGVNRDGKKLAFMSNLTIREFSDADIEAVIAYLRSQPPANHPERGGDRLNFIAMVMFGAGMFPAYQPGERSIAAPPAGATPEYGRYVATLGDCRGCHGGDMTGGPPGPGPVGPNPRPYVSGLTFDQFRQMLRTGVRPNSIKLAALMPWQAAARMTDDDLLAIYTYLRAPVSK